MKRTPFITAVLALVLTSCGGGGESGGKEESGKKEKEEVKKEDDGKGIGEIKHVNLKNPPKELNAEKGESIYNMKCSSCHKLTDERVVGPGFEGVTNRRKPEWIMNMITNVDVMLEEDPTAQKLLEECLTQMPNQNVAVGDARDILEFFRINDEERLGKRDEAADEDNFKS